MASTLLTPTHTLIETATAATGGGSVLRITPVPDFPGRHRATVARHGDLLDVVLDPETGVVEVAPIASL